MADSKKYISRVPSEYQEVEYIESNGTQYIDTNIIPTNSAQTKVQFEFQLTDITNGIYQSIGCNTNMNFTSSQTLLKFRSNGIEIANFDTAWHICGISKSSSGKVTYFDGVEYSTSTATEEALPFILFGMSLSDNRYYGKYKLKYFKCYENNTLVRNMIPVRRNSDNVLGMYDIVNNVFYTNQGTGSFAAGSDVNNWQHSLRKLGTSTDTLTTLPADIYADGQPIGANLFDGTYTKGFIGTTYIFRNTGTSANCAIIPVSPNTTYTVTKYDESNRFAIGTSNVLPYDEIQLTGVYYVDTATTYTFTTDNSAQYMVVYVSTGTEQAEPRLMANTGSTAIPYQPYAPTIIKGNMMQSGVPSPSSVIMPSETGDKTANLMPSALPQTITNNGVTFSCDGNGKYTISGTPDSEYATAVFALSRPITTGQSTEWCCNLFNSANQVTSRIYFLSNGSQVDYFGLAPINRGFTGSVALSNKTIDSISFRVSQGLPYNGTVSPMIASGSIIPNTFQPHGYEIPISSANTTTPVYLGEVQSTRKIKKLVFDGTENVTYNSKNDARERWVVTIPTPNGTTTPENVICTHFNTVDNTTKPLSEGGICMRITGVDVVVGGLYTDIDITSPSDSTTIVNAVKAYLAAQYTAGTPVCAWYVLATETTGIVNEPLRKIGDYADTVSGITIPTITGKDTLDVLTTLKPSEVELTYTGWHDASVKEKSRNLFDEIYPDISGTVLYKPIYVGNGSFTLSTTTPYDLSVANIFLLSGNVTSGASTSGNGVWLNHNVTTQSDNGYITIAYRHYSGTTSPVGCNTMLNSGNTALPYEPYWK